MKSILEKFLLFIVFFLLLVSCKPASPPQAATPSEPASNQEEPEMNAITVTSSEDSGPGTLRQALLDAQNGDTITFDPSVFPPNAPVAISTASELPLIGQGNLTLDASNAG